jgi:uncharacterized protein (DUF1015 family)
VVKIFPFQGILYNKDKLKDLSRVFTPPYDVISPTEQDRFYALHDFNFIRLILGKEFPGDSEYNNRYVRAAAFLEGWLRHKILIAEEKPALYLYEQRFTVGGKSFSRIGFIGLLRIEDMGRGKVYPHEATHSQAKIDRLQLMRATFSNLECIFSLYNDEENKVLKLLKPFMKRKPYIDVTDKDKVKHRLWKVDKAAVITKIVKEMKDKAVFIADGHHRYEAAVRFKNELKFKNTKFSEDESYNHIMMYFTSMEDPGLVILPIHRVIRGLNYFDPVRFEADLAQFFEVEIYKAGKKTGDRVRKQLLRDMEKKSKEKHCFGLYLGSQRYFLLTLKDENIMEEMTEEEKPPAWKHLDTNILQYVVLERILAIVQQLAEKVVYVKDDAEAVQLVDEKDGQAAFFLNPTKIADVIAIASKLEKMPQKSTFFYPKLLSGLVENKINHGEKIKL